MHKVSYGTLTDRKHVHALTFLCSSIYFFSYLTRINYKAVLAEIVSSEGISKEDAALALTGLFVAYGLGQLVSGWLGDRIRPKYLICGGLFLAAAMNVLLPLNTDKVSMTVIWSINGLGQAMMWPPIVRTLSDFLGDEDYGRAVVKVSWGSCFATILIYVMVPVLIRTAGWRPVFYICAASASVAAVGIFLALSRFERLASGAEESGGVQISPLPGSRGGTALRPGTAGVLILAAVWLTIVVQGALRDGIDTWMPSYLSEIFGWETSRSIFTGVLLPVATLFFYRFATFLVDKVFHNEMAAAASIFGGACAASFILWLFDRGTNNAAAAVACFVFIVGCTHGVNVILTGFVPRAYKKYGNISFISGFLNFGTYVGSAVATYGFASLQENLGWGRTIFTWIPIAFFGAAVCLALLPFWKKFLKKDK